jgi:hypothetical protein
MVKSRQSRDNYPHAPEIECAFPLHAFGPRPDAVGILGGKEAAPRTGHAAPDVCQGFPRNQGKKRITGGLQRLQQNADELRLVIEHLLKMRNTPCSVNGVAVKSAAKMVIDSSFRHLPQGCRGHDGAVLAPLVPGHAEQERKDGGSGKFRRTPEPARIAVKRASEDLECGGEHGRTGHRRRPGGGDALAKMPDEPAGSRQNMFTVAQPRFVDPGEQIGKADPAVPFCRGKIGSAVKRLQVRRQEHGHGPSTRLPQAL